MLINLDSDLIDPATPHHILIDFSKKDILDTAVMQAFPKLFNEGSHDNRTHNFVLTLKKNLSEANVKWITNRDNDNFNSLCSVGISIYIDDTCYCPGDFKTKWNIISDDKTPFSEDCPYTVTRVCYQGKCYCPHHQNISEKRNAKKFKGFSTGGSTGESSASVFWYNNNLKLCYLFVIMVSFF